MVGESGRLDHSQTDWPRVARAVYRVRQHYRYTYTGPVTDLKQRLVMIPPDRHGDQRLVAHDLDVRGTDGDRTVAWGQDEFGNRVCRVLADRVEHAVDFEATYRVERSCATDGSGSGHLPDGHELEAYLHATALTAPDARLRTVAQELARDGGGPAALAVRAHDWTAGAISYQLGVTGVQTPAAMALHLGKGVCQDYAHILLCLLRLLGVPARYVSGHLLGEGAPHAWVEVLLEDAEAPGGIWVIAYDPTNRRRAGLNYITVAVGRDYADITPTSGLFSGSAAGRLSSHKDAEMVEVGYADADGGDGGAREDAA